MQTLWITKIGSHLWLMDRPDSDIDIFTAYMVPTEDILSGENRGSGSHHSGGAGAGETDSVSHEIGKIIDQLIKGNINFLVGTLSPLVLFQHDDRLSTLKSIVLEHGQTKACTHSIRGLAVHNYKKYLTGSYTADEQVITKKCNTINRVLFFGINLLNGNGFEFAPVKDQTPDDVERVLDEFDKAVLASDLPDKTDQKPFREYLLDVRLRELHD